MYSLNHSAMYIVHSKSGTEKKASTAWICSHRLVHLEATESMVHELSSHFRAFVGFRSHFPSLLSHEGSTRHVLSPVLDHYFRDTYSMDRQCYRNIILSIVSELHPTNGSHPLIAFEQRKTRHHYTNRAWRKRRPVIRHLSPVAETQVLASNIISRTRMPHHIGSGYSFRGCPIASVNLPAYLGTYYVGRVRPSYFESSCYSGRRSQFVGLDFRPRLPSATVFIPCYA